MSSTNSVGIYTDTDTCLFHVNNLNLNNTNYIIYNSELDKFLVSGHANNFALFHVPFFHDNTWLQRLEAVYSISNKIFVFCSELHNHTVEQLINLDRPNISIFICGFVNYNFQYAKIYNWMDWFITTTDFYKIVQPDLLESKLLDQPKSKFFDILLGCERAHRNYVYNFINQNHLDTKVIMTYYRRWNIDLRQTEHIFETEGLEFLPESNYTHSVHHVLYYGRKTNLSQVIPFSIYNDSYYSLVAETNAENQYNFYTEKIVKPILGKRLFVAIAGQGYLKNLRSFGFKTFDSVVDESYDNEPDNLIRWEMAMNQVKNLINQDPILTAEKVKDIVIHNQKLMLQYDWYNTMSNQLAQDIVRIIDH
jgi:hypothetical protein